MNALVTFEDAYADLMTRLVEKEGHVSKMPQGAEASMEQSPRSKRINDMYLQGMTNAEIADAEGLSRSRVSQILRVGGAEPQAPGPKKNTVTFLSRNVVALKSQGFSFTQIGQRLGITRHKARGIYQAATE